MDLQSDKLLIALCFIFTFALMVECRNSGLLTKRDAEQAQDKKIICYYAYWAAKRPNEFRCLPTDMDPTLCTHILYAYARTEINKGIVAYNDLIDIQNRGWESIVKLKEINPKVKILLSVGGLFEGSAKFSLMSNNSTLREKFVKSASAVLKEHGFDGLDMAWLHPGSSQGSSVADKANYVTVMKELKEELGEDNILSMTVPANITFIEKGYDVPGLLNYTDFMNVLAFEYNDYSGDTLDHHSTLYSVPNVSSDMGANADTTIKEYLKRGAKPEQLNLIYSGYGVGFILKDAAHNNIGDAAVDETDGFDQPGAIDYFELCQRIKNESWTVKRINATAMGPYAYKNRLWVAYDDETMVKNKAKYALEKGLGGLGLWTVDQDDFKGTCGSQKYPLLRAGREVILGLKTADEKPPEN